MFPWRMHGMVVDTFFVLFRPALVYSATLLHWHLRYSFLISHPPMASHRRPTFVLFGASMTEWSFQPGGWGAGLASKYSRKADIILRGFAGWTTRRAVAVLEKIFPKDSLAHPALVVVFFGANDARLPDPHGLEEHIPIDEYKDNIRQIATYLKGLSKYTRVIFVTATPIDEEKRSQYNRMKWGYRNGSILDRTNKRSGEYAEACVTVAKDVDAEVVNLWAAIQRLPNWQECLTLDGMHLSTLGNKVLLNELLQILQMANWCPSLHWEKMPSAFYEP